MASIGSIITGSIIVDHFSYMSMVLVRILHLQWKVIQLDSSSIDLSMDSLVSSMDNLVFV